MHPDTGQPYLWIDDDFATPVNQAGAAPQALLDLIVRRVTASGGDAGDYDGEQLAQMLSGLNPEDFSDHAKWLELMMACHHATDGQGRRSSSSGRRAMPATLRTTGRLVAAGTASMRTTPDPR